MLKVFKYRFTNGSSAEEFLEQVNKKTMGMASHPYCGRCAEVDAMAVIVKGVGSNVFDINLKAECDALCAEYGGWSMPE